MKRFILGIFLLAGVCANSFGSNLRITAQPVVAGIQGTTALLEMSVSWDNSWKNVYNFDAVYIFGKYRAVDADSWSHIIPAASGHVAVTAGYRVIGAAAGVFVAPDRTFSGGSSSVTLRFCWQLSADNIARLNRGELQFHFEGIEMVYVPTSPYTAGDAVSRNAYTPSLGIVPVLDDIIGTGSFSYTASGGSNVAGAADRRDNSLNTSNCWYGAAVPSWWQVDFKTAKTIRYFGVSSLWGTDACPEGTWYLEGSANASTWTTVWEGDGSEWSRSRISFPVQHAIRVATPGAYRYYRIRIPAISPERVPFYSDVRIANVAMTENELQPAPARGAWVGKNSVLPSTYPSGYNGFFMMKYEVTQEQYVSFLNKQNYAAQYARTIGGKLDILQEGEYLFGADSLTPSFRNGIVLKSKLGEDLPAFEFACKLAPEDLGGTARGGQTLSCNYLSIRDMLSYADWAGLRPLSELEYEKAGRAPYPFRSEEMYAWGEGAAVGGSGLTASGTETEHFVSGNVHALNTVEGPVRSGSFLKSGVLREQGGVSFWGVEDLSGNLAEIYCNTSALGLQLNGSVHGNGGIDVAGDADVDVKAWPRDPEAYGVRGGSFDSNDSQALRLSDRHDALGTYFTEYGERRPEVGFRLGYSAKMETLATQLKLENGRVSGSSIVYDTICGEESYIIAGDTFGREGVPYLYTWYQSPDNVNWLPLKEGKKDLIVSQLTEGMAENSRRTVYYKRVVSFPEGYGESGTVALLVQYGGITSSRLEDNLRPCMVSPGFTVTSPLPASFEWTCFENGKTLSPTSTTTTTSHYDLKTNDFKPADQSFPSGDYTVRVKVRMTKRCEFYRNMTVHAVPFTTAPFTATQLSYTYAGTGNTYTIARTWGGQDQQIWTITNTNKGTLTIGEGTGVITGIAGTMNPSITITAVCAPVPDRVYSIVVRETGSRSWGYAGAAQSVYLLPGTYTMQCWGAASGGSNTNQSTGSHMGLGGYATGILDLGTQRNAHMYVGGAGSGTAGGWNGGGNSTSGYGGGGATDIRLTGGTWNALVSLVSRIMVAGGGGGADNETGEGLGGGDDGSGGSGGGLTGGAARLGGAVVNRSYYWASAVNGGGCGMGGTQIYGTLGQGEHVTYATDTGGGGGGYRGGYVTNHNNGGAGGGSGFVSGMSGCNAVNSSGSNTGSTTHSSGLAFRSASMSSGVRTGHGAITITIQ